MSRIKSGLRDPLRREGVRHGRRPGRRHPRAAGGHNPQNIRDIRDIYKYIVVLQRVSLSRMRFWHPRQSATSATAPPPRPSLGGMATTILRQHQLHLASAARREAGVAGAATCSFRSRRRIRRIAGNFLSRFENIEIEARSVDEPHADALPTRLRLDDLPVTILPARLTPRATACRG